MLQTLRHYLLAIQFFTRIPITGRLAQWVGYSPAMLNACSAHFPGVGWPVAAVAVGSYAALFTGLTPGPAMPWVAAVLSTIATVLLTGGFHEDAIADVADGLGGSQERERALEIMKDSRVGAFGAMALVLTLLAKISLLAHLGTLGLASALVALVGGHVLSRFWPLLLIYGMDYVGDAPRSKSKPLAERTSPAALWVGFLWCFPALALTYQAQTAIILIASIMGSAIPAALLTQRFSKRLQGFTGDCLGAVQQVGEIGFYLGTALALGWASR